ncbi:MAG: ABC transporter substrate-binding protein [Burkholderiaceae bacterium]
MRLKIWLPLSVLGLALVAGVFWWLERSAPPPATSLTLALPQRPATAAAFLGLKDGDFQRQGLKVTLLNNATAVVGLSQLRAGQADVALMVGASFVLARLKGDPLVVLASIYQANDHYAIVARKDKGIAGPADLAGKKIGVTMPTSNAYFAHAYGLAHGVAIPDERIVGLSLEQSLPALLAGTVDALVAFPPWIAKAEQALGGQAVILRDPTIYPVNFVLVSTRAWAQENGPALRALLTGLKSASEQIRQKPEDTLARLALALNLEPALIKSSFVPANYRVRLHPELLGMLEAQQAWALKRGSSPSASPQPMLDSIWFPGLEAVDPSAVTIRH